MDGGIRDERAPDRRLFAVGDEKDPVERDRLAGLGAVEQLHLELGPDLDAVLLSACLDDCVHGSSVAVAAHDAADVTDMETRLGTPRREEEVYGEGRRSVNRAAYRPPARDARPR